MERINRNWNLPLSIWVRSKFFSSRNISHRFRKNMCESHSGCHLGRNESRNRIVEARCAKRVAIRRRFGSARQWRQNFARPQKLEVLQVWPHRKPLAQFKRRKPPLWAQKLGRVRGKRPRPRTLQRNKIPPLCKTGHNHSRRRRRVFICRGWHGHGSKTCRAFEVRPHNFIFSVKDKFNIIHVCGHIHTKILTDKKAASRTPLEIDIFYNKKCNCLQILGSGFIDVGFSAIIETAWSLKAMEIEKIRLIRPACYYNSSGWLSIS